MSGLTTGSARWHAALPFPFPHSSAFCLFTDHKSPCLGNNRIMYTDGSTEELDLEEIIRDGHMSLITQ